MSIEAVKRFSFVRRRGATAYAQERRDLACAFRWAARLGLQRGRRQSLQPGGLRRRRAVPGQSLRPPLGAPQGERPAAGRRRRSRRPGHQLHGRSHRLQHPRPHPQGRAPGALPAAHPHEVRHGPDLPEGLQPAADRPEHHALLRQGGGRRGLRRHGHGRRRRRPPGPRPRRQVDPADGQPRRRW